MYVGEKGILLAGFNGQNPRVYPPSPKYALPPRQEIARRFVVMQARNPNLPRNPRNLRLPRRLRKPRKLRKPPRLVMHQSMHGSPPAREARRRSPTSRFRPRSPKPFYSAVWPSAGEKLLWDTAQTKVTNSEKANGFVDPPYRNGYTT